MAETITINGYLPARFDAGEGVWRIRMNAIMANFVFMDADGDKRLDDTIADLQAVVDSGNIVYAETSSSQTARTVDIPNISSWDDILNVPINIKAATYGTTSAASLNINGLGAKPLYFPNLTAETLATTPQYYWVRTGGVYTVVWDGTNLVVMNMQVRGATTSYPGIVQLSSSTSSSSTTLAATASAVYAVASKFTAAPLVLGYGATASGSYSTALGYDATASDYASTALGRNTTASGYASTASGTLATALGGASIALGTSAMAAGNNSIALGAISNASGDNSTALGLSAKTASSEANYMQLGNQSTLSVLRARVGISTSCDARDKTDVAPIHSGLEFLNRIMPVQYVTNSRTDYIAPDEELSPEELEKKQKYGMCEYDREAHAKGTKKGGRKRVGVLAQDVQQALVEVYGDTEYANIVSDTLYDLRKEGDVPEDVENQLMVGYSEFVPFLILAVQELSQKIHELEASLYEQSA